MTERTSKTPHIVISDREPGLPFSKGLTASQVMVTGLSPYRAYQVAERIEDRLLERGSTSLTTDELADLTLEVLTELAGDRETAIRRYLRVWRVDHGIVAAAFGLARTLLAAGDRAGAVAILDEVPEQSSQHTAAQMAAIRASLDAGSIGLTEADLVAASDRLDRLRLDAGNRARPPQRGPVDEDIGNRVPGADEIDEDIGNRLAPGETNPYSRRDDDELGNT